MDISGISGAYSQYASSLSEAEQAEKLKNKISSASSENATDEELMKVCKEFEAYFVEQMYKEMLKTIPNQDYSSKGTSTMMDFYKDELVKEIASQTVDQNQGAGANSLAQMLYEQMKHNYEV